MSKKLQKGVPLDMLIGTDKNIYELTNAAIHRAKQLSITSSEEIDKGKEKIVSVAINEIVSDEVEYSYKDK